MAKILLIEDNPKHSSIFSDILSDEGYEVIVAKNGEEVEKKINTQHKDNLFNLLLVDIAVPAFDAIEFIKTYQDKYKIIVISAYADTPKVAAVIDEKWRIKKPFDTNVLIERIKERLKMPIGGCSSEQ